MMGLINSRLRLDTLSLDFYMDKYNPYLSYDDLYRLPKDTIILINSKKSDIYNPYQFDNLLGVVQGRDLMVKIFTPEGELFISDKDIYYLNIEYVTSSSLMFQKPYKFNYMKDINFILDILEVNGKVTCTYYKEFIDKVIGILENI